MHIELLWTNLLETTIIDFTYIIKIYIFPNFHTYLRKKRPLLDPRQKQHKTVFILHRYQRKID